MPAATYPATEPSKDNAEHCAHTSGMKRQGCYRRRRGSFHPIMTARSAANCVFSEASRSGWGGHIVPQTQQLKPHLRSEKRKSTMDSATEYPGPCVWRGTVILPTVHRYTHAYAQKASTTGINNPHSALAKCTRVR